MSYSHWRNRGITILSLAGFAVTAYLTLAHLNKLPLSCESTLFDCGKVAQHPLAHGLGIPALSAIPTAVFGLAFFVAMLGLCAMRPLVVDSRLGRLAGGMQVALTTVALCTFALLTYAEMFIIQAWCPYCIAAALLTVGIMVTLLVKRPALDIQPFRRRMGESLLVVGIEIIGIALSAVLLWYIKYHSVPPPQIATELTPARLLLSERLILGASNAPYTLVEFANYRCPHCKASIPQVEALLQEHADTLRVVYSPMTRTPDTQFYIQWCAAEAAARQGKFVAMHHALYANQDALLKMNNPVMRNRIVEIAHELGLDTATFIRDLDSSAVYKIIEQREQMATAYRMFPLPKYVFFTPKHPPVVLHDTAQMLQWMRDPAHW